MYEVCPNKTYDFKDETYASHVPNLHKYPATMLPKIGIELFKELKLTRHRLLDPYCGTGSSALAGIASGFSEFTGFDINPLAILIAKARYKKLNTIKLLEYKKNIEYVVYHHNKEVAPPVITNIGFWFSKKVIKELAVIRKTIIEEVSIKKYQALFWVAFSETVRFVSYTRNNEFKLYKMPQEKNASFKPNVKSIYFKTLNKVLQTYISFYLPLLKHQKFYFYNHAFTYHKSQYDAVLTSPPYGDSRTTVAYGQFSTLSNEWMGFSRARKIDSLLMGGKKSSILYDKGIVAPFIINISTVSLKRALEVSAFYIDLAHSIKEVAKAIVPGGFAIYVVGNRTVKNITLPTDQFIAEQFEKFGFQHVLTYRRTISSKTMPLKNSPTNVTGKKVPTMLYEYIIVCQKNTPFVLRLKTNLSIKIANLIKK